MLTYPFVITQYKLLKHATRTEHWSLAAVISSSMAHIYELMGKSSNFSYTTMRVDRFDKSQRLRGGCQIGEIPVDNLEAVAIKLEEVPIIHNSPEFDCQTWVMSAISLLRSSNLVTIYSHIDEASIREELMEEDNRWEAAEDTLIERMFSVPERDY